MNKEVRQRHKETFTTVFTGLLVNYPLNLLGLFICIDLWGMTNTLHIGTTVTAWMTVVAYVRVYTIRRYFGRKKEICHASIVFTTSFSGWNYGFVGGLLHICVAHQY